MMTALLDTAGFERDILAPLCQKLNGECVKGDKFANSTIFERRVREILQVLLAPYSIDIDFDPHPHVFPDIVLGRYGIEVKFTVNDTWRSIANSVFESTRSREVRQIYVVYGKMGGEPSVLWSKYEEAVIHVRTSHVPRFEVEMFPAGRSPDRKSLFEQMGVTYDQFADLSIEDRMKFIREYAKGRLRPGDRLWWIDDRQEQGHSLPLEVRLYMSLPQEEKRRFRAEAALLCPQVVKPSRAKGKYNDAVMYLLTYHGVLCPQARDLFSAGSVALRRDATRGGLYIMRALMDIQSEMETAASSLEDALFVEYWGESVPPDRRIKEWLRQADELAQTWKPSEVLFVGGNRL